MLTKEALIAEDKKEINYYAARRVVYELYGEICANHPHCQDFLEDCECLGIKNGKKKGNSLLSMEDLTCHHIIFQSDEFQEKDEIDMPNNLTLLCASCHGLLHVLERIIQFQDPHIIHKIANNRRKKKIL